MGIDKFINDYLDGDLSPEEDKEFRKLLEEDALAQEDLDMMLSVISALKEDAQSIALPESLKEKVEQNALATYLKIVPSETITLRRKVTIVFAIMFLFIVFSINNINDSKITSGNSFFISQVIKQRDLLLELLPTYTAVDFEPLTKENSNSIGQVKVTNFGNAENVQQISISNVKRVSIENELSEQNESYFIEPLVEKFDNTNKMITSTHNYSISYLTDKERALLPIHQTLKNLQNYININIEKQKHSNVFFNLNEFNTDGVFISGYSTIPLSKFENAQSFNTYSQGLGYKVGNNLRIGLEFGHFDFDYKDIVILLVPGMQRPAEERKIYEHFKEVKNGEKILTNGEDNSHPTYIQVEVPTNKKYQQYWGGLFFDYEYPMKYTSLVGRIKVGATSDGFLGGLGFFAEIRPINNLSMNFGIENKTFWSSLPNETGRWKNILSLVYGLSVNFKFNTN